MLAGLIYVVDAVRRGLRKVVRSVVMLGQAFDEAQAMRRALPRTYMED
jgi:hypothetical protein